jgi:cell division protease FtsH
VEALLTAKPEETYDSHPDVFEAEYDSNGKKDFAQKNWPKDKINHLRDELFENGSEFMETLRPEVVGIDNVLVEIDRLIHWLANSERYQKYNARLEPGVIFEGDPGTGKTLVSRYIATASEALFINVRDFPHESSLFRDADIADLFRRARAKYKETKRPIVLFWDEFENGACERSNATPEQAATVSQLTAELDGIHGKNAGLLLIGCTNYIYGIDAALRRSGRMGLQIEFHAPDRHGKKLLLSHYIGKYKTKGTIDVETLSYFFGSEETAADIEESCMEAWRGAVYRVLLKKGRAPTLGQQDLIDVFLKRLVGPPTAFINLPLEDRAAIAIHEVGHAIMALVYDIPLRLITVQPGKKSLGRTIFAEVKEHIGTMDEIISDMRVGVGSICCEREAGLAASVGATGDVEGINRLAVRLVDSLYAGADTRLFNPKAVAGQRGGPGGASPSVSAGALENSDKDVKALLNQIQSDGDRVMASIGRERLWDLSNRVNEIVTLTGDEFRALFVEIVGDEPEAFRPGD